VSRAPQGRVNEVSKKPPQNAPRKMDEKEFTKYSRLPLVSSDHGGPIVSIVDADAHLVMATTMVKVMLPGTNNEWG